MPRAAGCGQGQERQSWMTSCHYLGILHRVLRNVAVVVVNGFLPFEFGTICEVFGIDRSDDGLPSYDFAVVAGEPPPLRAHNDFTIQPSAGLDRLEEADLISLPAVGHDQLRTCGACPHDLLTAPAA